MTIILKEKTLLSKGMEIALTEGGTKRAYGTITSLGEHKHDARYEEIGQCGVCGFDQYKTFEYDASIDVYSCTTNLEVNESAFFKITIKSSDEEKEWVVDLSVSYTLYESEIYDVDGKPLETRMKTGGTYIIQIIGKENINDVLVKVQDANDM